MLVRFHGGNFDSGGEQASEIPVIVVDSSSGGWLATISSDYYTYSYENKGGTYVDGTAELAQHSAQVNFYQCTDPEHPVYSGDSQNTYLLVADVYSSILQAIQDAYDHGEEEYDCYLRDWIKVTPASNCTAPDKNTLRILAQNTFSFTVESDLNWNFTYVSDAVSADVTSGKAGEAVTVTFTVNQDTPLIDLGFLDIDTVDMCTLSPRLYWSNWNLDIPSVIEIPASSTSIPRTSYSIEGSLNSEDDAVKVKLSGSFPTWCKPTIANTSQTTTGTINESGVIAGNSTVNTKLTSRECTGNLQVTYSGSVFVDQPIVFNQLAAEVSLEIVPSTITVEASGGKSTAEIEYNGTGSLTVTAGADWVAQAKIEGTTLSWISKINNSETARYSYIRVNSPETAAIINITQKGQDPLVVTITEPSSDTVINSNTVNWTASVNRNVATWAAASNVDWMSVVTGSKDLKSITGTANFEDNLTGADRVATLTVSANSVSATRKLTQKAVTTDAKITSVSAMSLDSGVNTNMQLTMGITGTVGTDNYSVNYRADQSWVNIDSSAMVDNSTGNTLNYGGYLKISTPANPYTEARASNLTVEFIENGEVKASQVVSIIQAASDKPTLTLSPTQVNASAKGGTGEITVTYTGTDTLDIRSDQPTWLTTRTLSTDKIEWTAASNTSNNSRTGLITAKAGDLEATTTVYQAGQQQPTVTITKASPITSGEWKVGNALTQSNLIWTASGQSYGLTTAISSRSTVSWIKMSATAGTNSTTDSNFSLSESRVLQVEKNTGVARTGEIELNVSWSNGIAAQELITVKQEAGGEDYLVITPDSLTLTKEASTQKVTFSYTEAGSLTTSTVGDAWVTGPTKVSGSGEYTFNVAANVTGEARETTFTYKTPSGIAKDLKFSQKADDSTTATVTWITPDSSPKTLAEGVYSDNFYWTATGKYSGSVTPRFDYEVLINNVSSSAVTLYPGDVNSQIFSDQTIDIKQKGTIAVNRNALQEGLNTVQVNPKVYQGESLIAQRTQTWLITKTKSSPSGSGSGSYDPGNPGDTDIPENYITVVNQATPFYIAEENTDFTFTAQYAGPYTGNFSINTSGVTEISRVDKSGNGIVNVLVTYRVTSSSQVTLRLSDSSTTLGYLTIPVYKVASTVYSVSDDVILSGTSGDLMTVTQNSTNRLIWNDPVYAAPGYTTVNINATQMLRELVEAPVLQLNSTSPRSLDTFSVKIGSKLSNLALVNSWNKFTTGFASNYVNSEIAFGSYIPATVINGGSIEIRTPIGTTANFSGNVKQYLDVTYKVSYCGVYRVNGIALNVVDSDYQLFFYNVSGGWSSLVPKAIANPGYQFTRSSYQLSSTRTRVYQVDTVKTWKLRTGWINEDLSDLFSSARVYLHDIKASKLYEVMITDTKYDFKTFRNNSRKLVSAEINVQSVDTQIRR